MIIMLNWVLPIIYVGYIVWRQWQPRLVTASYKLDALILAIGVIIAGTAVQNDWVNPNAAGSVSYTHLRAHETDSYLVCRLLLEKKKKRWISTT